MSIAIKTSDGDYIYFDAVLSYTQAYQNAVSKHPVDGGGNISDHITMENPVFNINGVISGSDFNTTRPVVGNTQTGGSISFLNTNEIALKTQVKGDERSRLFSLPFVSGIVKSPSIPDVEMADSNSVSLEIIKDVLVSLRDNSANADSNYGLFTVIEFKDGVISRDPYINCVLTNLTFNETPETGDCLDVTLIVEQVTFVTLVKTQLAKDISEAGTKDKATAEQSKGSQSSTTTTPTEPQKEKLRSIVKGGGGALGSFVGGLSN